MKISHKLTIIFLLTITLAGKADTLNVPLQYSSIQLALDNSESNDIILVQPGTYFENLVWPSINNIHLLSVGDTSNTFIDGGNYGRVITMNDSSGVINTSTIINGFSIQNGYVPDSLNYKGAGLYIYNCSPKLANLRIRNNKSQSWASYGVGIYIEKSNLIIEDITISNSEAINSTKVYGLGIYCDSSHISISNLTICNLNSNSSASYYGAGIYAINSYLDISNFLFQDNHLTVDLCYGGAINASNDTIILNNFEIKNNSFISTEDFGLIYGSGIFLDVAMGEIISGSINNNHSNTSGSNGISNGGGIYMNDFCSIYIKNILVNENTIESDDRAYGGGVYISDYSIVDIDSSSFNNNILYSNTWSAGGGIYISNNAEVDINHSNICSNFLADSNSLYMHGGGIYVSGNSSLLVLNSNINGNSSTNGAKWYHGGGIYVTSSYLEVINSVISNNILGLNGNWYNGGGIYGYQGSDVIVTNTTITKNRKPDYSSIKGSGICVSSSSLIMTNSISVNENSSTNNEIYTAGYPVGTREVSYSNTRDICPGPGNIDTNPLFVSDDDFNLQELSPCKNTGNPDTTGLNIPLVDIDGNPRIFEEIIDMGAYENQEQSVSIDFNETTQILVYPNPTSGIFYITEPNVLYVQVINEIGQTIIKKEKISKIDLSSYANGNYLVKITTKNNIIVRKIIKQ